MSTQKSLVLSLIRQETEKNILNGSYNFEDLNATSISIDLKIDRANVSRILNNLHAHNKLIKQKGRPTLYFSKEILEKIFPYLSIPYTLSSTDNLRNYISIKKIVLNNPVNFACSPLEKTDQQAFKAIFPILFYPEYESRVLILIGHPGSGRKHLFNSILKKGKEYGLIPTQSEILHYIHRNDNAFKNNINQFLSRNTNKPISSVWIDVTNEEAPVLYSYIEIIESFFNNQNKNSPIIVFGVDKDRDYAEITPYVYNLPGFHERKLENKLSIITSVLHSESVRLNREISISKKVLLTFLTMHYHYNVKQLKNELLYSISLALTNQEAGTLNNNIVIDSKHLSKRNKELDSNTKIDENFWKTIPDEVTIRPETEFNLNNIFNKEKLHSNNQKNTSTYVSILDFLCSLPVDSNFNKFKTNSLEENLYSILENTVLIKDLSLVSGLIKVLVEINNKNFNVDLYGYEKIENITDAEITYKRILRQLKTEDLSDKVKLFIRQIISISFKLVSKTKIPVFINSKSNYSDENFAIYFNRLIKQRLFFVLPKTNSLNKIERDFSNKKKYIITKINSLDRGNGTILLIDLNPKSEEYKSLLLELRSLTLSVTLPSIESISNIAETLNGSDKNIVSLSPVLIQKKNQRRAFFIANSLINLNERLENFVKPFCSIFDNVETKIISEHFFEVVIRMSQDLKFELNNKIILDFMFMGCCIISNKNNQTHTELYDENILYEKEIMKSLTKRINENEYLKERTFSNSELTCLYTIIYNNIRNKVND